MVVPINDRVKEDKKCSPPVCPLLLRYIAHKNVNANSPVNRSRFG